MSESVKKDVGDERLNLQADEVAVEEFLNKSIKEIIRQHPKIEQILDEFNIGCAPCSIGTCLLKDIVEIHNLSPEEEQSLMVEIAQVIYPGKEIKISPVKRKAQSSQEITYSPPIKKLVEEHVLIKRLVALIPLIINTLDFNSEENKQLILDGIDFIQSYADKYHHAKEEKILFNYFDENLTILKVIREDHEKARMHVRVILEALKEGERDTIIEHMNSYREILTEHIKKEDEILYPWIDRNLSITQIGNIFSKFDEIDHQFGNTPKKYEELVKKLEKKFIRR
jgi:hemerythrin-like domain-containing protein